MSNRRCSYYLCVRYTLVFICVIFCVLGGVVTVHVSLTRFNSELNEFAENVLKEYEKGDIKLKHIHAGMYATIAISVVCFVSGLVGTFGAVSQKFWTLIVFLVLIFLLIAGKIGITTAAGMKADNIKGWLTINIAKSVETYYDSDTSQAQRDYIHKMHWRLYCCGCKKGPEEFAKGNESVLPASCVHMAPCCDKAWAFLLSKLRLGGGVAIGSMFVDLLALFFTSLLIHFVGKRDKVVRAGGNTLVSKDPESSTQKSQATEGSASGAGSSIRRMAAYFKLKRRRRRSDTSSTSSASYQEPKHRPGHPPHKQRQKFKRGRK